MTTQVDCKGLRHLAIVAHHDDDLLFMHTDLRKIIDQGGCLRIVYLTASNAEQGPPYANDREWGVQTAYWSVLDPGGRRFHPKAGVAKEERDSYCERKSNPIQFQEETSHAGRSIAHRRDRGKRRNNADGTRDPTSRSASDA